MGGGMNERKLKVNFPCNIFLGDNPTHGFAQMDEIHLLLAQPDTD